MLSSILFSTHCNCTELSVCRALKSSTDLMSQQIVRLSEKKRNLVRLISEQRSLIKMLNRRGSRVEPCGTFDTTEKGEENLPNIWIKEDIVDK